MGPIASASYLNICECGKHGCVVLWDGSESPEFASKEKGFLTIGILLKSEEISDEKAGVFVETLAISSLAEMESEVSDLVKIKTAILNHDFEHVAAIKVCGYYVDPETFGSMFKGCGKKREMHLFYKQPERVM